MGVGISEILILLGFLFGGSFGMPMGMPPAPEDPLMFRIAPEKCLAYVTWTGVSKIDANANPTEAYIAKPEIQKMVAKLRKAYRGLVESKNEWNKDPIGKLMGQILYTAADSASTNPFALYVSEFELTDDQTLLIDAAAIIGLGDGVDEVQALLDQMFAALAEMEESVEIEGVPGMIRKIEIEDQSFLQFDNNDLGTSITMGLRGKYFVVGFGEEALQNLAKNSQTDPPKWLTEFRNDLPVGRFASMSYLNTTAAIDSIPEDKSVEEVLRILKPAALDDLGEICFITGLDEKGMITRTALRTTKRLEGILSAFVRAPIPQNFLEGIPADASLGLATRLSPKEIMRIASDTARRSGEEDSYEEALDEFQEFTGVSLRKELLESLGDFVYFYYQIDLQNPFNGWLISVQIDDEMSFPAIFDRLNQGIERSIKQQQQGNRRFVPTFEKTQIQGHDFYSFSSRDFGFSKATWGVIHDQWYLSSSAEKIIAHIESAKTTERLETNETIEEIYEYGDKAGFGGPIAVVDLNVGKILERLWPFAKMVLQQNDEIFPNFDFNFNDIPDIDALIDGVKPNIAGVFRTSKGIEVMQRQTYPGSSLGVTIAAISAFTIPTIADQFNDARTGNVELKMRQIAIAALNFEAAYQKLPAAYNTDNNGKPLLSWRVHILPFLDELDLYNQFHLDEPWDSEHNKQLIKKMPKVFKHPLLDLEPGKTSYLGVAGEGGAFQPAQEPGSQLGRRLATIQDGTAFSALLVEVDDENSVVWTQPVDLGTDGMEMIRKTRRIRKSNQFVLGFIDGSQMKVGPITKDQADAVLSVSGGEQMTLKK